MVSLITTHVRHDLVASLTKLTNTSGQSSSSVAHDCFHRADGPTGLKVLEDQLGLGAVMDALRVMGRVMKSGNSKVSPPSTDTTASSSVRLSVSTL